MGESKGGKDPYKIYSSGMIYSKGWFSVVVQSLGRV